MSNLCTNVWVQEAIEIIAKKFKNNKRVSKYTNQQLTDLTNTVLQFIYFQVNNKFDIKNTEHPCDHLYPVL
jgi:prefoldin subunit 5